MSLLKADLRRKTKVPPASQARQEPFKNDSVRGAVCSYLPYKTADWVAAVPAEGKGTWHVARLLQAALGGAREGWEERHIGGAESAHGALRCGQRREPRHQRREAHGLVIAGQGTVDGRWLERDAWRR